MKAKYTVTSIQYRTEKREANSFLDMVGESWESSSGRTSQFLAFCRLFRKEFRDMLKEATTALEFHTGHFEVSGFFRDLSGQAWYFNTGDLRDGLAKAFGFMLRTAKDFKDYTGGPNRYIPYDLHFEGNLLRAIKAYGYNPEDPLESMAEAPPIGHPENPSMGGS